MTAPAPTSDPRPWTRGTVAPDLIDLRVRLTPKAARDSVDALVDTPSGPAVAARVRAVPEDGAANAALARLVAGWIGMPKSRITVVSGAKSRLKTLRLAAADAALESRLAAAVAALSAAAGAGSEPSPDRKQSDRTSN